MKRIVKLAIHDYPKRTDFMRTRVTVEAPNDDDAMIEAIAAARVLWPGGKAKAFDVIKAPDDAPLSVPYVERPKRQTLKAKVA